MIRIALLDNHPAVLAGLQRLVEAAPGLSLLAAVETEEALWRQLDRTRPDVVVCDYDLARGDGLALCQRLKERARTPAVVIYSAYAGPALVLAARMAGADAVVDKGAPVGELLATVRATGNGPTAMPDVPCELRQAAMARLDDGDVVESTRRIVSRIRPNGPSPAAGTAPDAA